MLAPHPPAPPPRPAAVRSLATLPSAPPASRDTLQPALPSQTRGRLRFAVFVPSLPAPRLLLAAAHRLLPLTHPVRLSLASTEEREERDLIADINRAREAHGLSDLTLDPILSGAARSHSREMCGLAYFDHHSPTAGQTTPMDRYFIALRARGEGTPQSALVGENIFYASVTDATYNVDYAHVALMRSPGHRANILEPRFTKIGVGLYRDGQGRFWVTEMFLRDN